MNNNPTVLKAEELWKVYENGQHKRLEVLKGISMEVKAEEFVAIVGPSGAGKTTLLNLLTGMDVASEGEVWIEGTSTQEMSPKEKSRLRNQKMGLVFQFYHLLSDLTALENVMLPARLYSYLSGKALLTRARELLEQVKLLDRQEHFPSQLSGGEMQRVAIARALVNDPGMIFCDEPTGNLDSETGHEICQYLKMLCDKHKKTIIIVSHDDRIASAAHRVLHLEDGLWKTVNSPSQS